jgi:hypothetical protein
MAKNTSVIGIYEDRKTVSDVIEVYIKPGIGQRTSQSYRLKIRAQRISRTRNTPRQRLARGLERWQAPWLAPHWLGSFPIKL